MNRAREGEGSLPDALTADHPLFGLGYAAPVSTRPIVRLEGDALAPGSVPVAEEVPVALVYNGRPHVVMMATPADLEDFAIGFSLTEEIVPRAGAISSLRIVQHAEGIEAEITIPEEAAARLAARNRQLAGRTGCGLCGVETIQEAIRRIRTVPPGAPIDAEALWRAEADLAAHQPWNRETGSLHAAAWVTRTGEPRIVREDVGRHNALDKVIGALARTGTDPREGFFVVTSRASYEMVQKAAIAGVALLAAVSRPTDLAIRLAEASGMTLVALLRGRSANIYSHPAGIV